MANIESIENIWIIQGLQVFPTDLRNLFRHLHGNWSYEWPATAELERAAGLIDSFRQLHPHPLEAPGITYSTVYDFNDNAGTIPEPEDRIDFIFYKGSTLKPVSSSSYAGQFECFPADVRKNDWPTDHYAVVSEFQFGAG